MIKKIKYLLAVSSIIIILTIVNSLLSSKQPKKEIIPTLVFPSPHSQTTSLTKAKVIKFEKQLSDKEKNNLQIEIEPKTVYQTDWKDNQTLAIKPQFAFQADKLYQLSIKYQDKIISQWSFKTPQFEQLSPQEKSQLEGLLDPAGLHLEKAVKEKPWLLQMPIERKNYFIDYLGEEKGFRVLMSFDITSSLSHQEQIEQIKKDAPRELKKLNVNLDREKIYYTFSR